jgi:hypothetical protein
MNKLILLATSHLLVFAAGIALGVYLLPIATAPQAPTPAELTARMAQATFTARFQRDLPGSDWLHWGEGTVAVSATAVALQGELAPGPDYKLYLSPTFVDTEADFLRHQPSMVRIGDVKTFKNFIVPVPGTVDVSRYTTVIVWCETFGQFITAGQYQKAVAGVPGS